MVTTAALETFRFSPTAWRWEGHKHAGDVPVDSSFFVVNTPPGKGVALHTHPYAEVFILLEGTATFTVGDEQLTVGPDTVLVVPPDTKHGFQNTGDEPLLQVSIHDGGTIVQPELDGPP